MPRRSPISRDRGRKRERKPRAPASGRSATRRAVASSAKEDARLSETLGALEHSLLGRAALTAPEVAERARMDREHTRRLWRALGLAPVPDDVRAFTATDLAVLKTVHDLIDAGIARPEVLLQMARVIGQSLSRIAEAQVAVSADRVEQLGVASGGTADVVGSIVSAIDVLVPRVEPLLTYVWRRQLVAALMRAVAGRQSAHGQALVVGFADLVGFTAVSQTLSAPELASVVDRFETLAYEHITERNGRIVKMIGDEVMFTIGTVEEAAEVALALVEAYSGDETTPDARVGLAFGPVVSWEGDLLGPTVNLASRLVNIAYPGTVLACDEIGRTLSAGGAYTLRDLRPRVLKGIGKVPVWVLRRAETRPS